MKLGEKEILMVKFLIDIAGWFAWKIETISCLINTVLEYIFFFFFTLNKNEKFLL